MIICKNEIWYLKKDIILDVFCLKHYVYIYFVDLTAQGSWIGGI